MEKSPLGVLPRLVWETNKNSERIQDILRALVEYRNAGKPVPRVWLVELADLIGVEPESGPSAPEDAPRYTREAKLTTELALWQERALRWLSALQAIRDDKSWWTDQGSSVAGNSVIAKYAICDCWRLGSSCEFCLTSQRR